MFCLNPNPNSGEPVCLLLNWGTREADQQIYRKLNWWIIDQWLTIDRWCGRHIRKICRIHSQEGKLIVTTRDRNRAVAETGGKIIFISPFVHLYFALAVSI